MTDLTNMNADAAELMIDNSAAKLTKKQEQLRKALIVKSLMADCDAETIEMIMDSSLKELTKEKELIDEAQENKAAWTAASRQEKEACKEAWNF